MIIKAAKRVFNSDKIYCSYSDLNFGVIFWNTVYIGHGRLCVCVCLSVCLSLAAFPHYCTDPDVTWGMVGSAL